jgi:hypothetical protein
MEKLKEGIMKILIVGKKLFNLLTGRFFGDIQKTLLHHFKEYKDEEKLCCPFFVGNGPFGKFRDGVWDGRR